MQLQVAAILIFLSLSSAASIDSDWNQWLKFKVTLSLVS